MEDFSIREGRNTYYQNNKQIFDKSLEKMWQIFWEKSLDEQEYCKEICEKYIEKSITKVWLSDKKFDLKKMPNIDNLFSVESTRWWFGQITKAENVEKEMRRVISKDEVHRKKRLDWENYSEMINPLIEQISETVLRLKECSNNVILAAWFKEDRKKPLLLEIEEKLKYSILRDYRSINDNEEEPIDIHSRKWTLLRINANFRFYYLWKKTIPFKEEVQKDVVEKAYLKPCPEDKYQTKDSVIAKELAKKTKEIKEIRNYGGQFVLVCGNEDSKTEQRQFSKSMMDRCVAEKMLNYSSHNISEALNIKEELVKEVKQEKNNG